MHASPARTIAPFLVGFGALCLDPGDALAAGGNGGSAWSDTSECASGPVTGVTIRSGGEVDSVRFSYGDYVWAPAHGGTGGGAQNFFLPKDETIVEVRYRGGSRIDQLSFVTSKGRVFGPYGGGGGGAGVVKAPAGKSLQCMSGRSGSKLDRIDFGWGDTPPPVTTSSSPSNSGSGFSSSTVCTTGSSASGGAGVSGNNVQGGGSVGSGVSCTNTTGYADPNGYANVQLSCQSGMFASAEGQAGANGVMLCADASSGSSCTAAVGAGGTSQYGSGGGTAGVSGGDATGAGLCGGVTFTGGSVNIAMCGTLAYDVGVDVCINGSVNYAVIYGRAEPFASRAAAQAAKCAASNTAAAQCAFTVGDLLAFSAAPFVGRASALFDESQKFSKDAAREVWNDARSVSRRSSNYLRAADKFTGNALQSTAYRVSGQVLDASNNVVDTGQKSVQAATDFANGVVRDATNGLNAAGNGIANVGNQIGHALGF